MDLPVDKVRKVLKIAKEPISLETPIGEEGKLQRSVGQWLQKFNTFVGASLSTRVDDFFADNVETDQLPEDIRNILWSIVTVYWGLKGGFIWRELKGDPPPGYPIKIGGGTKGTDEYYLSSLLEADREQIFRWLTDAEQTVRWLLLTEKSDDFINELTYILTKKVDLADEEQMAALMEFIDALHQAGWSLGADMLYFDEQAGKFEWNKEFLDALEEEVLENRTMKKKGITPEKTKPEKPTPRIELAS